MTLREQLRVDISEFVEDKQVREELLTEIIDSIREKMDSILSGIESELSEPSE